MKEKLLKLMWQVRGLFPSPLPVGVAEFEEWAESIMNTYSIPTYDRTSIRFALATMIINSGMLETSRPKYKFVLALRAAAAKEVAGGIFHKIKLEQKERAAAEAAAKANEKAEQPKQ